MVSTRSRVALCAAIMLVLCAEARAQSPEDRASARLLIEQAEKKAADKEYAAAIDLFVKAFTLIPAPTIRLAQARVEAQAGHLIEAQQHLLEAARSSPQSGEPPPWASARQIAATEAEALQARIPSVEITVSPSDSSTTILVDGRTIAAGRLGIPRALDPGRHAIHVEVSGFEPADREVTLREGERQTMEIVMSPVARAPVAAPPVIETPALEATPESVSASAPPASGTSGSNGGSGRLAIVGFTVAGIATVVGTAAGIASLVSVGDIKSQCNGKSCPAYLENDADRAKRLGTVSTISFVLAGGALVFGIVALMRGGAAQSSGTSPAPRSVSFGIGLGSFEAKAVF